MRRRRMRRMMRIGGKYYRGRGGEYNRGRGGEYNRGRGGRDEKGGNLGYLQTQLLQ